MLKCLLQAGLFVSKLSISTIAENELISSRVDILISFVNFFLAATA